MVMRYYWGLAAGHVYTHGAGNSDLPTDVSGTVDASDNLELETTVDDVGPISVLEHENDAPDHDSEELGFENREDDFFDDAGASDEERGDDEEFLAMDSMYGFSYD
jgi:hypothetical protein